MNKILKSTRDRWETEVLAARDSERRSRKSKAKILKRLKKRGINV